MSVTHSSSRALRANERSTRSSAIASGRSIRGRLRRPTIPRRLARRITSSIWWRPTSIRYRSRFRLPASLTEVPGVSGFDRYRTFAHLLAGRRGGRSLLIFDVGTPADSGWAPSEWVTCAATPIALDAVSLAIEPKHDRVMRDDAWFGRVGTELNEFD